MVKKKRGRGGARPGAGRKPKGDKAGVSHRTRAPLAARYPVYVTVEIESGLPSLRSRGTRRVLWDALSAGCERDGFRVIQFSARGNCACFLVEAKDRERLTRGMQGLLVRLAKALNRHWHRKGKVFADRYDENILRTKLAVRAALTQVPGASNGSALAHPRTRLLAGS